MQVDLTQEEQQHLADFRLLTPGQKVVVSHIARDMCGRESTPPVDQNVILLRTPLTRVA
jgi:hypothetical protein